MLISDVMICFISHDINIVVNALSTSSLLYYYVQLRRIRLCGGSADCTLTGLIPYGEVAKLTADVQVLTVHASNGSFDIRNQSGNIELDHKHSVADCAIVLADQL